MTSPFTNLNTLEDTYFIAGSEFRFQFTVYDSGSLVNISSGSPTWSMASLLQPDTAILTKSGSLIDLYSFQVTLDENDTKYLSGKFIHQPKITDSEGYVFKPGQGIITIITGIN